MGKENIILAIESSCDDTSAAIIKDGVVVSNVVWSQSMHAKYGGIVPEVASRAHQDYIQPVVDAALKEANVQPDQLKAVAVTRGPGLIGSLIVGLSFAKGLAVGLDIPLIEVNHMEAHVLAHWAEPPYPSFPFLCLTVSGGHTQLVIAHNHLQMELLGETLDDAAGEAFDKTGKLLGLPYPAGPHIDRLAATGQILYEFPVPQIKAFDFSFSGLKTAILYFVQKQTQLNSNFIQDQLPHICASVQHTIIKILIQKLTKAAKVTGIKNIGIAGGVSANHGLRQAIMEVGGHKNWQVFIPDFAYCTDNAGMIGIAGYYKYINGQFSNYDLEPLARMPLTSKIKSLINSGQRNL